MAAPFHCTDGSRQLRLWRSLLDTRQKSTGNRSSLIGKNNCPRGQGKTLTFGRSARCISEQVLCRQKRIGWRQKVMSQAVRKLLPLKPNPLVRCAHRPEPRAMADFVFWSLRESTMCTLAVLGKIELCLLRSSCKHSGTQGRQTGIVQGIETGNIGFEQPQVQSIQAGH